MSEITFTPAEDGTIDVKASGFFFGSLIKGADGEWVGSNLWDMPASDLRAIADKLDELNQASEQEGDDD